MSFTEKQARMILAGLPGMGPVLLGKLEEMLGGEVRGLLEGGAEVEAYCGKGLGRQIAGWRRYMDLDRVEGVLGEMGADYVVRGERGYPVELGPYEDRPIGLYRYRCGVELGEASIAVVGTRRPTAYGRKVARQFAGELAAAGYTVVSGLAEGIDTEAHRAAMQAGGRTAAVLGGGLKRCYPRSNEVLLERVAESAGVWTEFPPWRQADRRTFPQRNRIVSGVSRAVVVVESGPQGGSLITARLGAEQGKAVYVVPGRIDMVESSGCHALIRDGAQLVTSVEEILEDLRGQPWNGRCGRAGAEPVRGGGGEGGGDGVVAGMDVEPELTGLAGEIWKLLRDGAAHHADEMAMERGVGGPEVQRVLLELEMLGHVTRGLDGRYARV